MFNTDNKIVIVDQVFTPDECAALINYYEQHGATHQWQSFFPMTIDQNNNFLSSNVKKIEDCARENFYDTIRIDWCEIVKWPTGAHQDLHLDKTSDITRLTSITYLNDDYLGGQTFVLDDIEVTPKIGRTILFNGQYYWHGVKKVLQGTRFTIPIWYKLV